MAVVSASSSSRAHAGLLVLAAALALHATARPSASFKLNCLEGGSLCVLFFTLWAGIAPSLAKLGSATTAAVLGALSFVASAAFFFAAFFLAAVVVVAADCHRVQLLVLRWVPCLGPRRRARVVRNPAAASVA